MKTLKQEIDAYVNQKRSIFSNRTSAVVRSVLNTLAPFILDPHKGFEELTKRGLGRYTVRTYFSYVSSFERERLGTKRFESFIQKNRPAFKNCYKEKTRLLKSEEFSYYTSLFYNANPRFYNLLILLGLSGLRISEARAVKWVDINDGLLTVVGKGGKQRLIPIDESNLKKNDSEFVAGRVYHRDLFKKHLAPWTPHDFRAFFATQVSNNPELGIKDAQVMLGHSSISTTGRYVRSDLERIKKVMIK